MKLARLVLFAFTAILVMSFVAASVASAGSYLFKASNVGNTFTGVSLAGTLKSGSNAMSCASDSNGGAIANVHLLGPFKIKFVGCKVVKGTETCPIQSPGANAEEIVTNTLHALLGLVLPSGAAGLLVLPISGKTFFTLNPNTCATFKETSKLTGSVAGLLPVSQIGSLVTESLVNFLGNDIKKIDTLAGEIEPELVSFGETAILETVEHLTWNKGTEVEVP